MAIIYKTISMMTEALKSACGLSTIKTHTIYLPALSGIVVDLGANVGEFSSAMAARGLKVHAVEASPDIFERIEHSDHIQKHNIAISDKNEPVHLFISDNPENTSVQNAIAAEYGIRGAITCTGTTLDHFVATNAIDQIGLLKIDIEGSEEQLFDSVSDDLLGKISQITIEFHDFISGSISSGKVEEIIFRLKALGFCCVPFSYMYPQMLNADLLFVQKRLLGVWPRCCFLALNSLLKIQRAKVYFTNFEGAQKI